MGECGKYVVEGKWEGEPEIDLCSFLKLLRYWARVGSSAGVSRIEMGYIFVDNSLN